MEKKEIVDAIYENLDQFLYLLHKHEEEILNDYTPASEYEMICEVLKKINAQIAKHINGLHGYRYAVYNDRKLKSETKRPLEEGEIANKETSFYKKKVVFTGTLDKFPYRERTAELLRKYGADINSSISSKTDIVIMGHGAGPSKVKKIEDLKAKGVDIKVLNEDEFTKILKEDGIID